MAKIHPTAIVDSRAELADSVEVGPYTVIEGDVTIDEGTEIRSHVLVAEGARIGKHCRIHKGAVLATEPQDLKFGGEKTTLEIGDHTIIREFCDLNRGTEHRGKTQIGSHCLLMAYTHAAHDCLIGDHVIMANGVQLAGHVTIEDWVIIGGLVAIHQFCRVGQHAMIGGGYRAVQDVPPFILAAGEPLKYNGVNTVGLRRRGFEPDAIRQLRQCYRLIFRSNMNTSQALDHIQRHPDYGPEVQHVVQFIEKSERGII